MRYLVYREDGLLIGSGFVQDDRFSNPLAVPYIPHPATLGCLLALVREALGIPYLCTSVSPEGRWWVDGYSLHDTEAEALVAALEAAP